MHGRLQSIQSDTFRTLRHTYQIVLGVVLVLILESISNILITNSLFEGEGKDEEYCVNELNVKI